MRYHGTINRLPENRAYAYIGKATLFDTDGKPRGEHVFMKDIKLPFSKCSFDVDLGAIVEFDADEDSYNPEATNVSLSPSDSRAALFSLGLDLHVDASVIDNPSIPLRWCFNQHMLNLIQAGLARGDGYAMLLRARKTDDDGLYEQREVLPWIQSFYFCTLPKPGEWHIELFLFERKNQRDGDDTSSELRHSIRSHYLERDGIKFTRHFADLKDRSYPRRGMQLTEHDDYGLGIAVTHVKLTVPQGIFAKEPSPALKAYANYFHRGRMADECELRGRLLWMIPGFFPWAFLELSKRMFHLVCAFAIILLGAKGSFKILGHTFAPRVNFAFTESFSTYIHLVDVDDNNRMVELVPPWNKQEYGVLCTPLAAPATYRFWLHFANARQRHTAI